MSVRDFEFKKKVNTEFGMLGTDFAWPTLTIERMQNL